LRRGVVRLEQGDGVRVQERPGRDRVQEQDRLAGAGIGVRHPQRQRAQPVELDRLLAGLEGPRVVRSCVLQNSR
jgi:hypothetical protein